MSDKGRKDKTSTKSTEEGHITCTVAAKPLTLAMLVTELEKNRTNITEELTNLIKTSLSPIQTTLESVKHHVESYEARVNEVEEVLSDQISMLETSVLELKSTMRVLMKENSRLRDMLDGYENRQTHPNVRVVGVRENSKRGHWPLKFILVRTFGQSAGRRKPLQTPRIGKLPQSADAKTKPQHTTEDIYSLLPPLTGEGTCSPTGYIEVPYFRRSERSAGSQAQHLQEGEITVV